MTCTATSTLLQGSAGHQDAQGVYESPVFGGERSVVAGELRVAPDHWVGEQWWEDNVSDCVALAHIKVLVLGAASAPRIVELLAAHYTELNVV
jgi:hypothetical protein